MFLPGSAQTSAQVSLSRVSGIFGWKDRGGNSRKPHPGPTPSSRGGPGNVKSLSRSSSHVLEGAFLACWGGWAQLSLLHSLALAQVSGRTCRRSCFATATARTPRLGKHWVGLFLLGPGSSPGALSGTELPQAEPAGFSVHWATR